MTSPMLPPNPTLEPALYAVGDRVRHELDTTIGVVMEVLAPAWSTWGDGSKTFDHQYRIDYRGTGRPSIPTSVFAERQLVLIEKAEPSWSDDA